MYRVLAVDDEPLVIDTLNMMLRRLKFQPLLATKGEHGINIFRKDKPHITILDLDLPDMNGLDVLERIRSIAPDAPVIIMTGGGTEAREKRARELGVTDFLIKGFSLHALKSAIDRAMNKVTEEESGHGSVAT